MDCGIWVKLMQRLEHAFGATKLVQIFMDEGDAHSILNSGSVRENNTGGTEQNHEVSGEGPVL